MGWLCLQKTKFSLDYNHLSRHSPGRGISRSGGGRRMEASAKAVQRLRTREWRACRGSCLRGVGCPRPRFLISAVDIKSKISYIDIAMNKRQRRTLARIFERPPRSDIRWDELASLMGALGAQEQEGAGSRVRFVLDGSILSLHRPHPKPELRKYAVEDVRDFLTAHGIGPEGN